MYLGDFRLGKTFDFKFCTVATTGAPTTLAGSPVISAYPDNSTTQLTAGITLSVDFDSVTGMHNVRVVATGGNGYATATNYAVVITTGTVGGVSVVGYVVAHFSIEARSALMPTTVDRTLVVDAAGLADANTVKVGPTGSGTAQTAGDIPARLPAALTAGGNIKADALAWNGLTTVALPLIPTTAGRTLDVSATGEAGVDWANVGGQGTVVGLTGTTIKAVTDGVTILSGIKKNASLVNFEFLMTDSTNHNPVTGKTVTVTRSIDDGAFAAGTLSAVTEIAFGIYAVDFAAGDLNGRVICLRAVATGCDDLFVTIVPDP